MPENKYREGDECPECPYGILHVMHHKALGMEKGKSIHYCPTGFLMCNACNHVCDEAEPHACEKWGES